MTAINSAILAVRRGPVRLRRDRVLQRALGFGRHARIRRPAGQPPVEQGLRVRAPPARLLQIAYRRGSGLLLVAAAVFGARGDARVRAADAATTTCSPAATATSACSARTPADRWCGQCPKCHFVFLALAPFVPKPRLLAIFGRNLLDDVALAPGFDALLEYRDHKPFECVGEGAESRAAMYASPAAGMAGRRAGRALRRGDPAAAGRQRAGAGAAAGARGRAFAARCVCNGLAAMRIAELSAAARGVWGYGREGRRSVGGPARAIAGQVPFTLFCGEAEARIHAARGTARPSLIRHRTTPPDRAALAQFDVVIKSPGISALSAAPCSKRRRRHAFHFRHRVVVRRAPAARTIA